MNKKFFALGIGVVLFLTYVYFDQKVPVDPSVRLLVQSVNHTPVTAVKIQHATWAVGDGGTKKEVVIFTDQGETSGAALTSIFSILEKYKNKVHFVFVDVASESLDQEKAMASECAARQNKFVEARNVLNQHTERLEPGEASKHLASIQGLDLSELTECMKEPGTLSKLKENLSIARALPIEVFPMSFIDGRKVEGVLTPAYWTALLER